MVRDLHSCRGRIEICAIRLLNDKPFTVVSCYRPSSTASFVDASDWAQFLDQFSDSHLIGGDFNAHLSLWGDWMDCPEGKSLVEAMEIRDVACLNDGSPTYLSSSSGNESNVDLTFVDSISAWLFDWKTGVDY